MTHQRAGDPAVLPPATELSVAGLAESMFGERIGCARRYAALLAGDGVAHGHLGPRELPRLWERHLLNCAAVTELLPSGQRVLDVGSGAGLPGLVVAIRRPDLAVTLLEPMQRRTEFLQRCIDELGLAEQVSVVRGRTDDRDVRRSLEPFAWITARAVAPLERLVTWCRPLLAERGSLLAMKGERASEELTRAAGSARAAGFGPGSVRTIAVGDDVSRIVVLDRLPGSRRDALLDRRRSAGQRSSRRARAEGGR